MRILLTRTFFLFALVLFFTSAVEVSLAQQRCWYIPGAPPEICSEAVYGPFSPDPQPPSLSQQCDLYLNVWWEYNVLTASCASLAGVPGSGVPSTHTVGTATIWESTCSYQKQYQGGCSPPSGGGTASCSQPQITWGSCSAGTGPFTLAHGATQTYTNVTSGYTGSLTATCNNGTPTATSYSCDPVATATASISASNCTIASGASTCSANVSWTSSNASSPSMRQNGSSFSTSASGNTTRTLSYGTTTYTFFSGSTQITSATATASCASGTSWNGSSCQAPAPSTPSGLTATAGSCGTGTINLSWNSVSGATSYTLQRATNSSFSSGLTSVYSGGSTSYSNTGLNAGTTYYYRVRASNSSGNSSWSSTVSRQAPAVCTYTISYNANGGSGTMSSQTKTQNVALTLSSNTFTRSGYTFTGWNTSSTGSGTSYTSGASYTANASATLYAQWSGATCSLPWGGMLTSGSSVTAYVASSVTSPSTCTSQTRTCSNGTLSGTYTNQTCTVGYVCTGSVPPNANLCANDDTGLSTNTARTVVSNCSSPKCQYTCASGYTLSSGSCVPSTYSYTFNSNGGTPTYSAASGIAGSTVSNPGSPTRSGYTFTGWSPALPTTMPSGGGSSAAQWSVNPTATISASNCTISTGASSCNSTVSWSSSNVSVPRVSLNSDSAFSTSASSAGTSRTIPYGANTFYFRDNVTTLASDGATASCTVGTSWNGSVCQVPAPGAPGGLTATAGACGTGTINLSWNSVSGAISYSVQRATNSSFSNGLTSVYLGTGTASSDTGLSAGTTYYYRANSSNGGGASGWSATVSRQAPAGCASGSISAQANPVPYESPATIVWSSSNTSSCTVAGDGGPWTGTSGSEETPALTDSSLFTLSCDGTLLASVTVNVLALPTLSIEPRIVESGTEVDIEYATNGQVCTLSGGPFYNEEITGDGVEPVTIIGNTTFTLDCPGGDVSNTVEVVPRAFES